MSARQRNIKNICKAAEYKKCLQGSGYPEPTWNESKLRVFSAHDSCPQVAKALCVFVCVAPCVTRPVFSSLLLLPSTPKKSFLRARIRRILSPRYR